MSVWPAKGFGEHLCLAGIGQRAPSAPASDTSSMVDAVHGGRRAWEIAAAMERYFRSQDSWYASARPRGGAPASAAQPMLRLSDLDRARRAPGAHVAAFERMQVKPLSRVNSPWNCGGSEVCEGVCLCMNPPEADLLPCC